MDDALEKILSWAKTHSIQTLQNLNPPASDKDISEVETVVGHELPTPFKNLLRRFDGENDASWLALLGNGNQVLSCKVIIERYKQWVELAEEIEPEMDTVEYWRDRVESNVIYVRGTVKPLFRHPKWIPFTCMNGDVYRFIDFDPAPGGVVGQVIEVDPESCSYQVLANGLDEALLNYFTELESGKYRVDAEGFIEKSEEEDILSWGIPEWLNI